MDPTHADPASSNQLAREVLAAQNDPRRHLGRYLMLSELGRGSFGLVARGWDPTMGRVVAIKLLNGLTERAQIRFRREIQAMAVLRHPNIATVFDSGEHQGRPYLIMDYLPGGTLADRVKRDGPLDGVAAAKIARDVARALHAAHQRGVLHRDIKPENVLFTAQGETSLVDFGLATLVGDDRITRDGSALGTPAYMPPEQAQGKHDEVDQRSDVYSLGATLYKLLVGRPPFEGTTLGDTASKILHDAPERISAVRPDIDPTLEAICLKCLEKAREDRYPTAEALAEDLEAFLEGRPASVGPKPNRLAAIAVALVMILIATGGVAALLGRRGEGAAGTNPTSPAPSTSSGAAKTDEVLRSETDAVLATLLDRARLLAPWEELVGLVSAAEPELTRAPFRLELRLAYAQLAQRRGRLELAEELATEVVEGSSGSLRDKARSLLATALAQQGEETQSRSLRRQVATGDAGGKLGLTAEAASRLAKGDPVGAIEKLGQARLEDPSYLPALSLLAEAFGALGEQAEALEILSDARGIAPDDVSLLVAWGRAQVAASPPRLAEAAEAAVQAAELSDPEAPPALLRVLRAELALRAGDGELALRELNASLERGSLARALVLRGMVQENEDDWRQAYAANRFRFQELVRELPAWPRLRACQSAELDDLLVCASRIRLDWISTQLQARLERRAKAVPQEARESLLSALLLAAQGRPWSEIKAPLTRAIVASPESGAVALESVRLHVGRDQYAAGLQEIERARALLPEAEVELLRWEGEVYNRSGRMEEARERYEAAAGAGIEQHAESRVARGEAALARQDFQGALAQADAALELDSRHPPALLLRAVALRCLGKPLDGLRAATKGLSAEGALNARLLMMRALCFSEALLGHREPTSEQVLQALEPFEQLFAITDGASGRILGARVALRHPDTMRLAGDYLQEARLLESDRAEIYLYLGHYQLIDGGRKELVLKNWRRARELQPELSIPQSYLDSFQKRFGEAAQLD